MYPRTLLDRAPEELDGDSLIRRVVSIDANRQSGEGLPLPGFPRDYSNWFGDDELRRRRFAAILQADMRRRDQLRFVAEEDAILVIPA